MLDKYGYVDVLVNNAGTYGPMSLDKGPNKGQGPLDGDPAEWDRLISVNLLVCRCACIGTILNKGSHTTCSFIDTASLSDFAGANAPHTPAVPHDEGSRQGRADEMADLAYGAPFSLGE